jgi:hypothetical protein
MQLIPSHTKLSRHLKLHTPVHSNVPAADNGFVLQLEHLMLAVAEHLLLIKVPFGHCSVHGAHIVPLFPRNVLFEQTNAHWFVQLNGPVVTGALQVMHSDKPSSVHGDGYLPGMHIGIAVVQSRHSFRVLLWYRPYLQMNSHSEIQS